MLLVLFVSLMLGFRFGFDLGGFGLHRFGGFRCLGLLFRCGRRSCDDLGSRCRGRGALGEGSGSEASGNGECDNGLDHFESPERVGCFFDRCCDSAAPCAE